MARFSGGIKTKSKDISYKGDNSSGIFTLSDAYIASEVAPAVTPIVASGGTVSTYVYGGQTYRQHVFSASGSFTIQTTGTVDVLIVGAGGGGGVLGGGGGGGGVLTAQGLLEVGVYPIVVGQASNTRQTGWARTGSIATKGAQTSAFDMIAYGGGGARGYSTSGNNTENQGVANYGGLGYNMTSYPGVSASFAQSSIRTGWVGSIYSGHSGGIGSSNCCPCGGGGGGGANGDGIGNTSANNTSNRPDGGDGISPIIDGVPMYNGTPYFFGGGGGADGYCSMAAGVPGKGGAGGASNTNFTQGDTNSINSGENGIGPGYGNGGNGGANTGGGGGAGSNGSGGSTLGGKGGSGIVVVRYLLA